MPRDAPRKKNPSKASILEAACCDHKVAFETYALANKVVKGRHGIAAKRQPYKCSFCGKYHIGSYY